MNRYYPPLKYQKMRKQIIDESKCISTKEITKNVNIAPTTPAHKKYKMQKGIAICKTFMDISVPITKRITLMNKLLDIIRYYINKDITGTGEPYRHAYNFALIMHSLYVKGEMRPHTIITFLKTSMRAKLLNAECAEIIKAFNYSFK
jgi:hypothetical protein